MITMGIAPIKVHYYYSGAGPRWLEEESCLRVGLHFFGTSTDSMDIKFSAMPQHPMGRRMAEFSNSRLKRRTSFAGQSKAALLRQHQGGLPRLNPVVVIDYYNRYYEIAIMKSTTAEKTVEQLRRILARHMDCL